MDSWLRGLRGSLRDLPDDIFYPAHRELISRLLACSSVRVATTPAGEIAGYAVSDDPQETLHWIYVKEKYRNQKVSKRLLEHFPLPPKFTFRTYSSSLLRLSGRADGYLRRLKSST